MFSFSSIFPIGTGHLMASSSSVCAFYFRPQEAPHGRSCSGFWPLTQPEPSPAQDGTPPVISGSERLGKVQ
jgi:hypothetical protein